MGQRSDKFPTPNFQGRDLAKEQRRDNPRYMVDAYEKEGFVRDPSAVRAEGGDEGWDNGRIPFGRDEGREISPKLLDKQAKASHAAERSSDVRIKEEICERIENGPNSGGVQLDVSVHDGEVKVEGVILEDYMRGVIQNIVQTVDGVKTFVNNLRVSSKQGEDVL